MKIGHHFMLVFWAQFGLSDWLRETADWTRAAWGADLGVFLYGALLLLCGIAFMVAMWVRFINAFVDSAMAWGQRRDQQP